MNQGKVRIVSDIRLRRMQMKFHMVKDRMRHLRPGYSKSILDVSMFTPLWNPSLTEPLYREYVRSVLLSSRERGVREDLRKCMEFLDRGVDVRILVHAEDPTTSLEGRVLKELLESRGQTL